MCIVVCITVEHIFLLPKKYNVLYGFDPEPLAS